MRLFLTLLIFLMPQFAIASDMKLVMFEEDGCVWCERWHKEIGPAYPKTLEGRVAPLMPIDINAPLPAGIEVKSPPVFTPTFVLIRHGKEVGRIEGYPGDEFFWVLLERQLKPFDEYTANGDNS